jgi:hypothetical protein
MRGRASAITIVREIFTPPQGPSWIDTSAASRDQSSKCSNFQESENIPHTPSPASRSINHSPSSNRTLAAFWRVSLTFDVRSIRPLAKKRSGSTRRRLFQSAPRAFTTPRSWILARSFVSRADRDAECVQLNDFVAQ